MSTLSRKLLCQPMFSTSERLLNLPKVANSMEVGDKVKINVAWLRFPDQHNFFPIDPKLFPDFKKKI